MRFVSPKSFVQSFSLCCQLCVSSDENYQPLLPVVFLGLFGLKFVDKFSKEDMNLTLSRVGHTELPTCGATLTLLVQLFEILQL